MTYLFKNSFWLAIILSAASGCKKFVTIDPPYTQMVTGNVFKDATTTTSALTYIYTQMSQAPESFNMSLDNGLLADELKNYSNGNINLAYYANAMNVSQGAWGPWQNAYSYIYNANAIIEGLQNNTSIVASISNQLIGESKFIRAFWHFYLTNIYGDVPLVTSTLYTLNSMSNRTPRALVYQQIV